MALNDKTPSAAAPVLTKISADSGLPVLSSQQVKGIMGETPKQLGKGGFGSVFINEDSGLVMKKAASFTLYKTFFLEAMVMKLFAQHPSGF